MPINVIGFAVAKVEADKHGVGDQEATRIGVIGAVMPNPIMSLVVARSMGSREEPAASSSEPVPPGTILTLPPPPPPAGTGTGGATGGGDPAGGGRPRGELLAHIDQAKAVALDAKAAADQAKTAAENAGKAVESLATVVRDGFQRIDDKLSKPASTSLAPAPAAPASPVQQSAARGKGTSGDKL